jgi:RNA polymerase sigma factor (TIGR02999 family)
MSASFTLFVGFSSPGNAQAPREPCHAARRDCFLTARRYNPGEPCPVKIPEGHDVTALLRAWSQGDAEAGERLVPLVYDELRRQAAIHLRRERRDHTLRPTGLVHEVYLRLVDQREAWQNRTQFFALAARVMRRILVDHARRHLARKRGGSRCRVSLDEADGAVAAGPDLELMALEQALTELATLDEAKARVVELRFFGGLSLPETAAVLEVSESTVSREWRMARAWLYRRITREPLTET